MNDTRQLDQIHQKVDKDLKRNPGIGQSKGAFSTGIPPEEIEGENTVEGDTENNAGRFGEVKIGRERTNKYAFRFTTFLANSSPTCPARICYDSRRRTCSSKGRGTQMEFELETNSKWRLASLLMTVAVVGGAIAYAMTAA